MKTTSIMKILREAKGYSQDYVGSILGIEQNTYSKLENGQIRLTADRIYKLAELYDVVPELFVSKELPIVNFNTGSFSKGIINTEKYNEQSPKSVAEILTLKDKIIEEKDKYITNLKEQLEEKKYEISFWRNLVSNQKQY